MKEGHVVHVAAGVFAGRNRQDVEGAVEGVMFRETKLQQYGLPSHRGIILTGKHRRHRKPFYRARFTRLFVANDDETRQLIFESIVPQRLSKILQLHARSGGQPRGSSRADFVDLLDSLTEFQVRYEAEELVTPRQALT